jgi:hypothetical protein
MSPSLSSVASSSGTSTIRTGVASTTAGADDAADVERGANKDGALGGSVSVGLESDSSASGGRTGSILVSCLCQQKKPVLRLVAAVHEMAVLEVLLVLLCRVGMT